MDFSMFENIPNAVNMTDIRRHSNPVPSEPSVNTGKFPESTPLAMAYVPFQQWSEPYDIEKGFEEGTIFPDLNFPFTPEEGCI